MFLQMLFLLAIHYLILLILMAQESSYRGHVKVPHQYLLVMFCEELSHPHLLPYRKFGFQIKRQIALSPTKYFNQRLLNLIFPAMFLNFSKLYFWGVLGGGGVKGQKMIYNYQFQSQKSKKRPKITNFSLLRSLSLISLQIIHGDFWYTVVK